MIVPEISWWTVLRKIIICEHLVGLVVIILMHVYKGFYFDEDCSRFSLVWG